MNRFWSYLFLQLLGWSLFGVYLMTMVFVWGDGWEGDHRYIWLNLVILLVCASLSHGLRFFYRRRGWSGRSIRWVLPRIFLVSIVFALLAQTLIHTYIYGVLNWSELQEFRIGSFLTYCSTVTFVYFIWSAIYFSEHAFARNQRDELEKWKLKAALKEAELMALKAQINPHFLFNALNNIRALVLEDADRARAMISHLSDMLRYSVQSNEHKQVPLQQELDMVQNYLTLEGNQYEDRLRYTLEASPNTLDKPVPPMAVQIL
ncbi:MAG: histidine kinase, partial [Bacteroidota bacterium]